MEYKVLKPNDLYQELKTLNEFYPKHKQVEINEPIMEAWYFAFKTRTKEQLHKGILTFLNEDNYNTEFPKPQQVWKYTDQTKSEKQLMVENKDAYAEVERQIAEERKEMEKNVKEFVEKEKSGEVNTEMKEMVERIKKIQEEQSNNTHEESDNQVIERENRF